jgi:hypothetical protein
MKKLTFLMVALGFFSCKNESVSFTSPQPTNQSELSTFPKKYQGYYENPITAEDIIVYKTFVTRGMMIYDTLAMHELETIAPEVKQHYKAISDSLYVNKTYHNDTVFSIQKGDVLKKLKGNLFLNIQNPQGNWGVTKFAVKNKILSISQISTEKDIMLLDEILEQESDSTQQKVYTLTKKEFKEFVDKNGFQITETFLKQ